MHADHVTGTGALKGVFEDMESVISDVAKAKSDVMVKDGDLLMFGKFDVECRSTPGHTDGTYLKPLNHSQPAEKSDYKINIQTLSKI